MRATVAAADRSSNRLRAREKGKAELELLAFEFEFELEFAEGEDSRELFLACNQADDDDEGAEEGLDKAAAMVESAAAEGSEKVSINRSGCFLFFKEEEDDLVVVVVGLLTLTLAVASPAPPTKAGSTNCFQCSKLDSLMAALNTGLVLHK
mmetsp:Transcript_30956/g.74429  ORF Transcript_30956/g.74429 Transcript_30956/m.74429 type:complete len:151 (-) Transcript_30956:1199-1651(-)